MDFNDQLSSRLGQWVRIASLGCVLIGSSVILGWTFEIEALKRVVPGLVAMNPVTALCFILCGAALWLIGVDPSTSEQPLRASRVGMVYLCAALVALVGTIQFARFLIGWDAGIDQWLFFAKLNTVNPGELPNRMAPNTAVNFVLIGGALLLLNRERPRGKHPAQYLALTVAMLSWLALLGYAYGTRYLYGVATYIPMALNTAFAFLLLAFGILCARPARGLVAVLTSRRTGGLIARRVLPAMVLIPFALGALRIKGQNAGYYDTEMGVALMVGSSVILLVTLIWWSAATLNRADGQRHADEARIHELNEQLHARAAQLEAANKELEAFSYSVSHDLRAPLRHISGFVDLMRKDAAGQLDATGRRYLDIVAKAAGEMGMLIDDLLDFCKSGRAEMRSVRVEMDRLVTQTVEALGSEAGAREVCWTIHPLPDADADPGLLRQVWANLISNALKYSGPRAPARIEIGCKEDANGEAVFYVRDNGVGFDMRYADKLFGVFQRLHHADEFEGTGIGLANVRRIVARHGGRTWAEGRVDAGATFYFSLPMQRKEIHAPTQENTPC